ncbi:ribosome maturation factor RimM [Parabacteroides sp. OttesenSCG-928-G06]|nr:ribosome maturation factor RimM [Parabacteroides sp. OttesenSCG-928-K15]MDL2282093.1 ribosome maturation factor RimM [Parabacteroides sp. OttesenSCG-928-G06]
MIRQEDLLKIGRFTKPHGVKGEIALQTTTGLLEDAEEPYLVCEIEGIFVPFFLEEYRYKSNTILLVKLEDIDSEEQARRFAGLEVYLPYEMIEEEKDLVGEVSWDNFIGYMLIDETKGAIGPVIDVDESTLNVLFHIDRDGEEFLFPAVEELITAIDYEEKELRVNLPEGLLDL